MIRQISSIPKTTFLQHFPDFVKILLKFLPVSDLFRSLTMINCDKLGTLNSNHTSCLLKYLYICYTRSLTWCLRGSQSADL